jgi:hypothetical protein
VSKRQKYLPPGSLLGAREVENTETVLKHHKSASDSLLGAREVEDMGTASKCDARVAVPKSDSVGGGAIEQWLHQ